MTRWLLAVAAGTLATGAPAQVYGAPGGANAAGPGGGANPLAGLTGAFAPNVYDRGSQPLSPYLNLLRGGNPAVNYFYGVRPGLNPAVAGPAGRFGSPPGAAGSRFNLQPAALPGELPFQPLDANTPLNLLPSAAHPVTFGNGPGLGRVARRTAFAPGLQTPSRGGTAPAPRRR